MNKPSDRAISSLVVIPGTTSRRADAHVSGIGVRHTTEVSVEVSALGGAVSVISLGKGLLVSSPALQVTSVPTGLSGFSLGQGQSRTFVFGVKGVKAGDVTVRIDVSGTDSADADVTASGTAVVKVGGPSLAISVTVTPRSFNVASNAAGQVGFAAVTVRMTNTSKQQDTNIQMLSLTPVPADHTQAFKALRFSRVDQFPLPLGALGPGASLSKTFYLSVVGGVGFYQVEALALFDDPTAQGGNGRAFAVSGRFSVVTKTFIKLIETNRRTGKKTFIYIDRLNGEILGVFTVRNPATGGYDEFFYNKRSGNLVVQDPSTGAPVPVRFDPQTSNLMVASRAPGQPPETLHYDAASQTIQVLSPQGSVQGTVLYDPRTGTFH